MLDRKKIARWIRNSEARWAGYNAAAEMMRRTIEGSTTSFAQDAIDRLERNEISKISASLNLSEDVVDRHSHRVLLCGIMTREGYSPTHIPFEQFHDTFQKLLRYLHDNGFLAVFVRHGPNAEREGVEDWLFYASWGENDDVLARPFDGDERS